MSQTRTAWDVRTGEILCLVDGDKIIHIRVDEKSGQRARLVVSAPDSVHVSHVSRADKHRSMFDIVKPQ